MVFSKGWQGCYEGFFKGNLEFGSISSALTTPLQDDTSQSSSPLPSLLLAQEQDTPKVITMRAG